MVTKITSNDFATGEFATFSGRLSAPTISSVTFSGGVTILDPSGGTTVTINGANFSSPKVLLDGVSLTLATTSSTVITFTSPAKTSGVYSFAVVNSDGTTAYSPTPLQYSSTPTWVTASGAIATQYEASAISVQLSATSDTTITYTITSGALPSGVTLSSSGLISGTLPVVSSQTTYNFDVTATDSELQTNVRSFSIVSNIDVVTWTSIPAINAFINGSVNQTMSATSAAGKAITYSSSTLPSGLSISGNAITGTATSAGTFNPTITATAADTGKTADTTVSITITAAPGQQEYTSAGTYTWTAPPGVTSVSVVCVGGGGGGHKYTSYARGGGGGGLGWKNDIAVTPGNGYTVVVGSGGAAMTTSSTSTLAGAGGTSYFITSGTVAGTGGGAGFYATAAATRPGGGSYVGDGGGTGGLGGWGYAYAGGGGGAAGYTGAGGSGCVTTTATYGQAGNAGAGGGAGGGGGGGSTKHGGMGGGVGLQGQGNSGAGGGAYTSSSYNGKSGGGGSGGGDGSSSYANTTSAPSGSTSGGAYGGGGGGTDYSSGANPSGSGGVGAVRIIWGAGRSFPSTNTGNV